MFKIKHKFIKCYSLHKKNFYWEIYDKEFEKYINNIWKILINAQYIESENKSINISLQETLSTLKNKNIIEEKNNKSLQEKDKKIKIQQNKIAKLNTELFELRNEFDKQNQDLVWYLICWFKLTNLSPKY